MVSKVSARGERTQSKNYEPVELQRMGRLENYDVIEIPEKVR